MLLKSFYLIMICKPLKRCPNCQICKENMDVENDIKKKCFFAKLIVIEIKIE